MRYMSSLRPPLLEKCIFYFIWPDMWHIEVAHFKVVLSECAPNVALSSSRSLRRRCASGRTHGHSFGSCWGSICCWYHHFKGLESNKLSCSWKRFLVVISAALSSPSSLLTNSHRHLCCTIVAVVGLEVLRRSRIKQTIMLAKMIPRRHLCCAIVAVVVVHDFSISRRRCSRFLVVISAVPSSPLLASSSREVRDPLEHVREA